MDFTYPFYTEYTGGLYKKPNTDEKVNNGVFTCGLRGRSHCALAIVLAFVGIAKNRYHSLVKFSIHFLHH